MADNILSILVKANAAQARAELRGFGTDLERVSRAIDLQQARFSGLEMVQGRLANSNRALLLSGAALGGGLVMLAKSAMAPEQELRNVNTMAKLSEAQLGNLRVAVSSVSSEHNVLADRLQVTQGIYDVMSVKGYTAADATAIVGSAAVLATGGHEQLQGAIQSTMDIMTSYGRKTPAEAQKVTDELYAAVQIGRMRLADLTGEIGPAMSVSSKMGVDEKEVLAGLAVLTNQGFGVSEAATAIERTMTSALKPSKEFTAAAKEMGYESTAALVRAKGLAGALDLVQVATKGDETAMAAIFPNIRALRGVLALGGESAKDFAAAQIDLANSSGAASKAAAEQLKGPEAQLQKMLIDLKSAGQDLGRELFPELIKVTTAITGLVKSFNELSPEAKLNIVRTAEWTAGLLLAGGAIGTVCNGLLTVIRLGVEARGVLALLKGGAAVAGAATGGGAAGVAETAAAAAAEVVAAASGVPGKRKSRKAVAAAATTTAAPILDLADDFVGSRDFAAEEAALDAEWEKRQAAWRKEHGGLEYQFESQRNLRKERRGVIDTKAARNAKAFDARALMGADDVVAEEASWTSQFADWKAKRGGVVGRAGKATGNAAEIEKEGQLLAKALRVGQADIGRSLRGLPRVISGQAKIGVNAAAVDAFGPGGPLSKLAADVGMATRAGVKAGAPSLVEALAGAGTGLGATIGLAIGIPLAAFALDMKLSGLGDALKQLAASRASEDQQQQQAAAEGYVTKQQVATDMGWSKDEYSGEGRNIAFRGPLGGEYSWAWSRQMKQEDRDQVDAEWQRRRATMPKTERRVAIDAQRDSFAAPNYAAPPTPAVPSRPQNVSSAAFGMGDQRQFVTVPVIINGENRRQILRTIDQRLDQVLVPG